MHYFCFNAFTRNKTKREMAFSEKVINQLMLSFEMNGKRNAFCISDKYYNYISLATRVNAIRKSLKRVDDDIVGLVANDDINTYASILALWMEGKCYVPLHPGQPLGRCLDIISQVGIKTITDSSASSRYDDANVILTSQLDDSDIDTLFQASECSDSKLAYILFTSGSTGRPKGVPIMRANVASFVDAVGKLGFKLTCDDRCLQMFDLTFDLSVQSFLLPLLAGACVYTVPYTSIKYQAIFGLIDDYHLTVATIVPSVIHYLRPYMDEIEDKKMRYSLLSAEALNADDVAEWAKCVPNAQIWNMYGPTESTIYCTAYHLKVTSREKQANGTVSIGQPLHGVEAKVLNDEGKECNVDEKGELCLAGDQLTPGYWQNEDKNHEAFFIYDDGTRYYRTGDICAKDADGDLLYYGRKDYQIKIQGYRIELSEIECVARRYFDGNKNIVALPIYDRQGNCEIHLAVEDADNSSSAALMDYLKTLLPAYMLPAEIHFFEKFPQNTNNKTDRNEIKKIIRND
jgi:D-alanine--poly(phosphoribitol) ligase subunit 1